MLLGLMAVFGEATANKANCYTSGPLDEKTYYMFGDIKSIPDIASASACQAICQKDSECGVFV